MKKLSLQEVFFYSENLNGGRFHSNRPAGGIIASAVFVLALVSALLAVFFTGAAPAIAAGADPAGGAVVSQESDAEAGRRLPANLVITVSVPESTPAGEKIFVAGSHEKMGGWSAPGTELTKVSNRVYRFAARLDKDCEIEFKFTRGDFAKVEKDAKGHEIPNRKLFFNFEAGENKIDCEIGSWADINPNGSPAAPKPPEITGRFEFIKKFKSKILDNERDIIVLLPPSYFSKLKKNAEKRYPVLYMHDGNNLFDPNTSFQGVDWGVDEAGAKLYKAGAIEEMIVVAIYNNADRMSEYTPFKDPKHGGGDGDKYMQFIISELMPHINSKYRTLTGAQNTAIGGSSLGGLISLYAAAKYSDKFSKAIVMSPSIWWADGKIIDFVTNAKLDPSKTRIWMDIGQAEGEEAISFTRKFSAAFKEKFPNFKTFSYKEFTDAPHNETAWRARVELPMKFMFAKNKY